MTAVARMALLDWRTVAPYRLQGAIIFVMIAGILASKPAVLVPALVLLLTATFAAYPFQVGDKAGLDTLYSLLPIPRRAVVLGHYAWALACYVFSAVAGSVLALVVSDVRHRPLGGHEFVISLVASWAVFGVVVGMQYPLFMHFGYTRISALGTTMPVVLVLFAELKLNLVVIEPTNGLLVLGVLVPVALLVGSVLLSGAVDRGRVRGSRVALAR
jgi:hypothetical protein